MLIKSLILRGRVETQNGFIQAMQLGLLIEELLVTKTNAASMIAIIHCCKSCLTNLQTSPQR